jgi:urea transport system permease protein
MNARTFVKYLSLLVGCLFSTLTHAARADTWAADVLELRASDVNQQVQAVDRIAKRGGHEAIAVLEALNDTSLQIDSTGAAYRRRNTGIVEPIGPHSQLPPKPPIIAPVIDNELRRALEMTLATLRLTSSDSRVRRRAAEDIARQPNDGLVPIVRRLLVSEKDTHVRRALALSLAWADIDSPAVPVRIGALMAIADSPSAAFKPAVERVLSQGARRQPVEASVQVRAAASKALSAIRWRETWTNLISNLYYGLSLGSVLLLISLGLAITFGLMRVINMAHGELLMIGAYATFVVQQLFLKYLPSHSDWYPVVAVPAAFLTAAFVGIILERLVLRFLHGRPLETLLATWGVSLVLIQVVRQLFGAQNVTVANPAWLSGGIELFAGFVLTYNRAAVILFSWAVMSFVWFVLRRTRLGLQVRAVTQNRDMAASMGIATRRVDSWTFAMGAGVAGLGGVALSQLGNVGPELGQGYIIDAFMVVVLGGVGNLAGTLAGAMGLGIATKWAEPIVGAVLGKIVILVLIILFIQRRPQGLFALKGRAVEV